MCRCSERRTIISTVIAGETTIADASKAIATSIVSDVQDAKSMIADRIASARLRIKR